LVKLGLAREITKQERAVHTYHAEDRGKIEQKFAESRSAAALDIDTSRYREKKVFYVVKIAKILG
jgi:hypothetical protein